MAIDFTNEQVYALYDIDKWWHSAGQKQVFEISGKPGCGKSFIIRYFVDRIGLNDDEVLFAAYTGKAVTRMIQSGVPAKTLHSIFYDYVKKKKRDEQGRLVIDERTGKVKYIHKFILKDHIPSRVKLIVIDEASMVPEDMAEDILSFDIPIVTLGDLNQLPPVFGKSYFLRKPDVVLTQIMRQAEGNPIVWLSEEVINGRKLVPGMYGNSAVIRKEDLNTSTLKRADIIITGTNRLRYNINNYMRKDVLGIKNLQYPHMREKMVCRKNNWNYCIDDKYFLMNGITGVVAKVYQGSYNQNTGTMKIDFQPDFTKTPFKNLTFDYEHLYEVPGRVLEDDDEEAAKSAIRKKFNNIMEYAYAITTHSSQGSSWPKVLYMREAFMRDPMDSRKLDYTAITRAEESVTIVL